MIKIKVVRDVLENKYTLGKMYINGEFMFYTVEDTVRDLPEYCPYTPDCDCKCKEKIKHETAIPKGKYKVILSMSPRFKKALPRLLEVPHFTGVLIHSGNTSEDSSGCIIIGMQRSKTGVLDSRNAMNKLTEILSNTSEQIQITIE